LKTKAQEWLDEVRELAEGRRLWASELQVREMVVAGHLPRGSAANLWIEPPSIL
jgi:hypothetical protein